jgi:hypothetical protein
MKWNPSPYRRQAQQETLRQAEFSSAQMDRWLRYRAAYCDGSYQDDPTELARLHFARWLYQHGKISG